MEAGGWTLSVGHVGTILWYHKNDPRLICVDGTMAMASFVGINISFQCTHAEPFYLNGFIHFRLGISL